MGYASCPQHDYARLTCADCLEARTRPPQKPWLLTGIEKEALDKIKADPELDTRDYRDQHYDLDSTATVRVRPANWMEQIGCLIADDVWVREVGGE